MRATPTLSASRSTAGRVADLWTRAVRRGRVPVMRILLGALARRARHRPPPTRSRRPDPPATSSGSEQVVDAGQSFRGLDAVDRRTAWIGGGSVTEGGAGTVWRTTDGGDTWQDVSPPDSAGLLFRDVEARSADVALVLAIGPGEASRIYRTTDGGETWTETFRNPTRPRSTTAWTSTRAAAAASRSATRSTGSSGSSAPTTAADRGRCCPNDGMPDSTGEFNFAASGDCLVIRGKHAWFGGGGAAARIFHSTDRGLDLGGDRLDDPGRRGGRRLRPRRSRTRATGWRSAATSPHPTTASTRRRTPATGASWRNGGDLDAARRGRRLARPATADRGRDHRRVGRDRRAADISWDGGRTWQPFSEHRLPHAGLHR